MEKVTFEVGWLSLAHQLLNQAVNEQKRESSDSTGNEGIAALLSFYSF
ncbi:hypothetical protein [Paenibacillus albidus]|nr:hypothetical protein [Paenibacillus albidus]